METSTLNETNSNNSETSSLIKKCSLFDFKQSKPLISNNNGPSLIRNFSNSYQNIFF